MKDHEIGILYEILPNFVKTNQPDKVRTSLRLLKILTDEECDFIKRCNSNEDEFLTMFNMLKAKSFDDTFKALQKLCIELKWRDLFHLIRKNLQEIQKEDLLISEAEQQDYHDIFTYCFRSLPYQFTGRENYLKEIRNFFQQNDTQNASSGQMNNRVLVISGLGGVGKTQLVTAFMNKQKVAFDSIIWLNAESEPALISSFYGLASMLDIDIEKNSSLKPLVYKIFQKLLTFGTKHLAIFDNADQVKLEEILADISHRACVLITSRHQNWPNRKVINLGVFTPEEAKDFVLQTLNIAKTENENNVLKLGETLDYFPLALQQATAYINYMAYLKTYMIEDYLIEYEANEESTKELLRFQLQKHNEDANLATTFATWKITFNNIKDFTYKETPKECQTTVSESESLLLKTFASWKIIFYKIKHFFFKEGLTECQTNRNKPESLPLKLVYIMAYLASDNIPATILEDIEKDKKKLIWAIDVLKDFCFVSINNSLLKVHKMVQLVTHLQLAEEKRSVEFLNTTIQLLVKVFPCNDDRSPALEQKRILLPHLAQVHLHVEKTGNEKLIERKQYTECRCSILDRMCETYWNLGDVGTTKTVSEKLLKIKEKYYSTESQELMITISYLGNVHWRLGYPQTAIFFHKRVLTFQERHYGPDHFQLATTLSHLSNAYCDLGDPQTSKSLLERALAIQEGHYGPDHFQLATTLSNLSNAYRDLGDPQTSKSLLERALAIQEGHYGPDHFQLATTLSNLSIAYRALGVPQTSKSLLERALAIQERHFGPDHFQLATTLSNLSIAYRALGDPQTSKSLLERALAIQERHFGPDHFQLAITLSNLAINHRQLGDPQTSKSLLERALAIQEGHYGPDHFQLATTLSNLSKAYCDLGDFQTSKYLLERALVILERH